MLHTVSAVAELKRGKALGSMQNVTSVGFSGKRTYSTFKMCILCKTSDQSKFDMSLKAPEKKLVSEP